MENATKLRVFPCFRGGGCPARVRKPESPRPGAVQPPNEGRRLTGGFVEFLAVLLRIIHRGLRGKVQAF